MSKPPVDSTRRKIVTGIGMVGATGLAGCLGGSGDSDGDGSGGGNGDDNQDGSNGDDGGSQEKVSMTLASAPSGTTTFEAGQALSRAASQHSDLVTISVQETSGWSANLRLFDNGEAKFLGTDNNSLLQAKNSNGAFEDKPVSNIPLQGFIFNFLDIYVVAIDGSGIETTDDLKGKKVWPLTPGWGTRALTEEVFRNAGLWENIEKLNVDASDTPGMVEEGRADALVVLGTGGTTVAGWMKNLQLRGEFHAVKATDSFKQAIKDTSGARYNEFEPYGWEQDITPDGMDKIVGWSLDGQWVFGPDVSTDTAYEIARISHEHNDTIREATELYMDHSDPENMTVGVLPDLPVHPGIVKYFKETNVWNDDWVEG